MRWQMTSPGIQSGWIRVMRALKVIAEGLVTSFRYPHFIQGVHPTYEMPPPSTIYGYVCSAIGELVAPIASRFAYHFTYVAKFVDYEHLHFFGKEPKMNPFRRELLFKPRLTLYLDNLDWENQFRSPRYAMVLGRAQDLMTITEVSIVELMESEQRFYCGTLLTLHDAALIGGPSFAVTMPRYIDENRRPTWGQYGVLPDSSKPHIYPQPQDLLLGDMLEKWVDPSAKHPYTQGLYRAVVWHTWQEGAVSG
jgi:CRISPR-associated protein Cas5t